MYGLLNEAGTFEEKDEPSLSPLSHIVGHINVFFKDCWTIDFLNEKEGENQDQDSEEASTLDPLILK